MTRISFMRKTPEGWQTSVRRMVALHGVRITPEQARSIVRYLSDELGIAPDELRPARYEVERRPDDFDWDGDSGVEYTCLVCHSMGRVSTQRRTKEEWALLMATHRGLYPLVDFQAFRRSGPPPTRPGPDGSPPDPRHPMDKAVDHLSARYPLTTPEWSAWSANKRAPRIEGSWTLSGRELGKGSIYGTVTVSTDPSDPASFTTIADLQYVASGERVSRTGRALVYTGFQWRGRSNPDAPDELREVMMIERDQQSMSGRWFRGAYDEIGPDVTLRRMTGAPIVTGMHPTSAERGTQTEVMLFGGDLPEEVSADELDLGNGVLVLSVEPLDGPGGATALSLHLDITPDAPVGTRDLFAFGQVLEDALAVHDGIDRIEVAPATGMARVGGVAFPKGYQPFEAIAYDDGPDGDPDTEDDVRLGFLPVSWSLEEYTATYDDDDLPFVGAIDPETGLFTPAADGPNPERVGNRNNVGDVWVVATHPTASGDSLRARAHLLVTVPNYMRFEPWREVGR